MAPAATDSAESLTTKGPICLAAEDGSEGSATGSPAGAADASAGALWIARPIRCVGVDATGPALPPAPGFAAGSA